MPAVSSQPLLVVADVAAACAFYERLLGLQDEHGGPEYRRLTSDGELVLQLHARTADHHHGPLAAPGVPPGDGVLLWFSVVAFDAAVDRSRALGAVVVADVHVNPNAGQRELWLRDLDGYLVVLSAARPTPG